MSVPSVVSAQRPSRGLGYGHISRSAKRVGNNRGESMSSALCDVVLSGRRAKRNHQVPSGGRDLLPTSSVSRQGRPSRT